MNHKYFGSADHRGRPATDAGIAEMVEGALRPLAASVGLDEAALAKAVERNLSRRVAKAVFDALETEGIPVHGADLLDLGAGLGHGSVEAVARGARVTAVEPGFEWCRIVRERLRQAGSGDAVVADGERLPFAGNRFDLIVSIGVLEHVRRPDAFLREAYRVLRPGGWMFLSCENYLSFREPHYQLAWFPLLPKPLASIYLRLRGRSDEFLRSSIYYTTRPGVLRSLRLLGFRFKRETNLRDKLRVRFRPDARPGAATEGATREAASAALARVLFEIENLRGAFTPHVATVVGKPVVPGSAAAGLAR